MSATTTFTDVDLFVRIWIKFLHNCGSISPIMRRMLVFKAQWILNYHHRLDLSQPQKK